MMRSRDLLSLILSLLLIAALSFSIRAQAVGLPTDAITSFWLGPILQVHTALTSGPSVKQKAFSGRSTESRFN
jgi:hypothetical protein